MADDRADIRRELQGIAEDVFPDNTDVRWDIRDIVQKGAFFCVEAEPVPPTVGYPRFRFVLTRAASGAFRDEACYCLREGTWALLCTSQDAANGWQGAGFADPNMGRF